MSGYQDDPYKKTFHTPSLISLIRFFFFLEKVWVGVSVFICYERDERNFRNHDWIVAGCHQQTQERQSSRQQRNECRRQQSMRRRNERNVETDLQWSDKTKRMHTRSMAKNKKKWYTQKATLKMLETIARYALCLRCTNCLRQYCTADFISDLIKSKQKIRQGSDAHIRQRIIWRRTEWLNKDVMRGESKGGLLQSTSCRRLIPITHNSIWDALKSCGIEHDYIHLLKRLFKNQKDTVMIDEESMFEIKKGSKQGDPLSSLLFNTVLQMALKDDLPRWQKKRGMGICLGDNDHDSFTNMRFADDVLQKKVTWLQA